MPEIGVVGATGVVGRELLTLLDALLDQRGEQARVVPIASPRSAGVDLTPALGLRRRLDPVRAVDDVDWTALDVAFFSAGAELSRTVVSRAAAAGCLVIDNTSAFRGAPGTPLVVPQVNGRLLAERPVSNVVANPNCSTIQLVRVLAPLHAAVGLERVVVATYQAASGGGSVGLAELADRSLRALTGQSGPGDAGPGKFGPSLAFNLVPHIGPFDAAGVAHEERKIRDETRVILEVPDLDVSATAVRVPVFHCHSEAVWLDLAHPVDPAEVARLLTATPGIRVHGPDADPPYPMPVRVHGSATDRALVHVGRLRVDPERPATLMLWIVADNLWVGAAHNAVTILSAILDARWWDGD